MTLNVFCDLRGHLDNDAPHYRPCACGRHSAHSSSILEGIVEVDYPDVFQGHRGIILDLSAGYVEYYDCQRALFNCLCRQAMTGVTQSSWVGAAYKVVESEAIRDILERHGFAPCGSLAGYKIDVVDDIVVGCCIVVSYVTPSGEPNHTGATQYITLYADALRRGGFAPRSKGDKLIIIGGGTHDD